jgi:membrane associated rhomboid family serine protease
MLDAGSPVLSGSVPQEGTVTILPVRELRIPWATLSLAVAISAIHATKVHSLPFTFEFVARAVLIKDIIAEQPERLFTSALVHSSNGHVYANVVGLLLAGWIIEGCLGRAVLLNVALWGGAFGMGGGALAMGKLDTAAGASAMLFALAGAFLTWRALSPASFGSLARHPLVWAFFLLYAAAALASNDQAQGQAHFFGFAYGVGWGLVRERFPVRWRRRFAALAILLYAAATALVAGRALRQDPSETTEAVQLLLDRRQPPAGINDISWYWTTQVDAPQAVLERARERMTELVEEKDEPVFVDTLATLHFRLGDLDQAIELERRLLLRAPPVPNLHLFTSQLARFEHARLVAIGAPSLAQPPLRLRRAGEGWRLESAALPPVAVPPRRALILNDGRPAGYLEVDVSEHALPVLVAAAPTAGDPASEAEVAVVPLATLPDAAARPTRLWWMDPEIAALP